MAKPSSYNKKSQEGITPSDPNASLKFLWIGILVLFAYLMLYNSLKNDDEDAITTTEAPEFNVLAWFNGTYQDKTEAYLKNDSRIGKELLPLKNQIDFDVFDKYNMEDYIKGKRNYLLSEGSIFSYLGKNYLGDSVITERSRKLKVVSDTLRNKGINLVVLLAPTKEYFEHDLIPDKYNRFKKQKNNYEYYLQKFNEYGILHIDLLPFFAALKTKYPNYPIFPQFGTHPSYFTECMIADTAIKFIERIRGVEMPHIAWNEIEYPSEPKVRDADAIAKARLKDPPQSIPMAYPKIGYTGTAYARPVKTLGIGDSYYRSFAYLGVMQTAFGNGDFWYYNNTVVPETPDKKEVWELDLKKEIEKNEVILIEYCSNNLNIFAGSFIEDAYELYTNPKAYYTRVQKEMPVKRNIKTIHQDTDLLDEAQADAKNKNITLDSAIKLKAIQMLNN